MDSDRTTMMGSASPAALAAEEACPACDTTIQSGEEFCPKCGYQRGTWQGNGQTAAALQPVATEGAAAPAAGPALWTLSTEGASWPLGAGEYVLGRGEVELRVDDGYASRRHAQLAVTADSVTLTDLGSSNGTFIGERRLEPNTPEQLPEGASFRVANTVLSLGRSSQPVDSTVALPSTGPEQETAEPKGTQSMDAEIPQAMQTDSEGTVIDESSQLSPDQPVQEPPEASSSHWELRRKGGETIEVPTGEMTLGRKEAASRIVEGDSYISGCHCRLIASEDSLEIIDLHSTNGSFVNEARLDPEQPWQLQTGDKVRLGQTTFEVVNNKAALTEGQVEQQLEDQH